MLQQQQQQHLSHKQATTMNKGKKAQQSSAGGASSSITQNQMVAVADLGNALLRYFVVPFGPVLIDRRLNVGFFRASDTPYWWALVLLAFVGGEMLACWMRRRPTSWHLYMNRPPKRRATRIQAGSLAGLTMAVIITGMASRLDGLLLARFATGFFSSFLWGNSDRLRRGSSGSGGGGAAAGAAAAGRWSNNRIAVPRSASPGLGEEGPLINPMLGVGMILGGLLGGLAFPFRTFALVNGRPALMVSILVAGCVFLLGSLVLRRMNKELATLGRKTMEGGRVTSSSRDFDLTTNNNSSSSSSFPSSSPRRDASSNASNNNSFASSSSSVAIEMSQLQSNTAPPNGTSPPNTYLKACGNNRSKALAKYQESLAWRARLGVDAIHEQPHPTFAAIKQYYPHFVHGRTRNGEMVVYEFPGRMDLGKLKAQGIGAAEIGRHYIYFCEFLYRCLSKGDEGRIMTVLDIGGLGITSLSKDVLDVLRTTSEIMSNHYPERVTRICVVNVPFFIGGAWKVLASVLPQSVQDRIELSPDPGKDLRKYIAPEQIPRSYGGHSPLELGHSEEEVRLRVMVERASGGGGGGNNRALAGRRAGAGAGAGAAAPATAAQGQEAKKQGPVGTHVTEAPASPRAPPSSSSSAHSRGLGGPLDENEQSNSGWFSSWVWKRPTPPQAHLGYENKFIFDQTRKMWVLEDEMPLLEQQQQQQQQQQQPQQRQSSTQQQHQSQQQQPHEEKEEDEVEREGEEKELNLAEEDGLIMAIQAAHYAERLTREGKSPSNFSSPPPLETNLVWRRGDGDGGSGGADNGVGAAQRLPLSSSSAASAFGGAGFSSSSSSHSSSSMSAPSTSMLIQMSLLFGSWALLQHALLAMLPLWALTSHEAGGLALRPATVGVGLSLVATAATAYHTFGPPLILRLPWSSPLRAFRLAVISYVAATVMLSFHPQMASSSSSSSSSHSSSVLAGIGHFFAGIFYFVLLACLVGALAYGRAAASVLLDMVLRAHLQHHPGSVLHHQSPLQALATVGEIVGPLLGAAFFSWSLLAESPFPMDTRSLFNFGALVVVLFYTLSLQLDVVLTGDHGSMALQRGDYSQNLFYVQSSSHRNPAAGGLQGKTKKKKKGAAAGGSKTLKDRVLV